MELIQLITWLGIVTLLKLLFDLVPNIYYLVKLITGSGQIDFKTYGEWAIITGCTDGIGKGFAEELARRGLNIILISRNEEKLRNTATKLEEENAVKTVCIQADFTRTDCYDRIKQGIEGKDIAILVNNVGIGVNRPVDYWMIDKESIWNQINANCAAASIMTRITLPHMISKRKGLIVNISSIAGLVTLPYTGVYAATKSFLNMFSINLQEEVESYNIKVKCFTPGCVDTNMLKSGKKLLDKIKGVASIFVPDPKTYANSAINSLSETFILSTGYWPHTLLLGATAWLSWKARSTITGCQMRYLASYLNHSKKERDSFLQEKYMK